MSKIYISSLIRKLSILFLFKMSVPLLGVPEGGHLGAALPPGGVGLHGVPPHVGSAPGPHVLVAVLEAAGPNVLVARVRSRHSDLRKK